MVESNEEVTVEEDNTYFHLLVAVEVLLLVFFRFFPG